MCIWSYHLLYSESEDETADERSEDKNIGGEDNDNEEKRKTKEAETETIRIFDKQKPQPRKGEGKRPGGLLASVC